MAYNAYNTCPRIGCSRIGIGAAGCHVSQILSPPQN
jgi:hypothetical protein